MEDPPGLSLTQYIGLGSVFPGPQYLFDNILVSAVGRLVRLRVIPSGETHFIDQPGITSFISALATNPTHGLLAFSGRSASSPIVYVYAVEQDCDLASVPPVLKAALRGGPPLEHSCLAISRDGEFVAAVGSCLEYQVNVWRTGTEAKVVFEEKQSVGLGCSMMSFNPLDSAQLCFSGERGVEFWEIVEEYGRVTVGKRRAELGQQQQENVVVSHLWQLDSVVVLVMAQGVLVKVDAKSGKVLHRGVENEDEEDEEEGDDGLIPSNITTAVHIAEHIIVACSDHTLRWLDAVTLQETASATFVPANEIAGAPPVFCHATLSASCTYMLGCSNEGEIYVVNTAPGELGDEDRTAQLGEPIMSLHVGPVLGLAPLYQGNGHLVASVGMDGKLRVWDVDPDAVQRQYDLVLATRLAPGLCCVEANPNSSFLAVGSTEGELLTVTIRFHEESGSEPDGAGMCSASVVAAKKAFDDAVGCVQFNRAATQVLATCKLTKEALIYDVQGNMLNLSTIICLSSPPSAGCWTNLNTLVFACDDKCFSASTSTEISKSFTDPIELEATEVPNESVEGEDFPLLGVCAVDPEGHGFARFTAKTNKLVFSDGTEVTFDKGITFARPVGRNMLALGGVSGAVKLMRVNAGKDGAHVDAEATLENVVQSAVTSVCYIPKGNMVIVADFDGGLAVYSVHDSTFNIQRVDASSVSNKIYPAVEEVPDTTDLAVYRSREAAEREEVYKVARNQRACKVDSVAKRLEELLQRNEEAPELEKMDPTEFVIDVCLQERERAKSEAEAVALGKRLTASNEAKAAVVQRLKDEFWSSMGTHKKAVLGVGVQDKVENFALPVRSKQEMKRLEQILHLRRIELLESSAGMDSTSDLEKLTQPSHFCPEQMDWMLLGGLLRSNAATKEEEEGRDGEGRQETGAMKMVYHPMAVRSNVQKRTQLILLGALKREHMEAFNESFDSLFTMKEELLDTLNSKRGRMDEISVELGVPPTEAWPALSLEELPEKVLTVTKEEMGIDKYISKAERERLEREELERQRRELEAAKDDLGERALQDMMNGRLEGDTERGLLAQEEEAAPEWMAETKLEEMTDEQKAEVEAWEERQKEAKEQREKLRKALELELKKLQVENADMIKAFNDALRDLHNRKIESLHTLNAIRLYEAHLHLSLREDAHLLRQTEEISRQQVFATQESTKASNLLQAFSKQLEAKREQLFHLQEADRQLEKAFRPAIQQAAASATNGEALDNEDFKILQQLFRLRIGRTRSSLEELDTGSRRSSSTSSVILRNPSMGGSVSSRKSSSSVLSGSISRQGSALMEETSVAIALKDEGDGDLDLDPFSLFENQSTVKLSAEKQRREALAPLEESRDLPEGFSIAKEVWSRLQELRLEKMKHEFEVRDFQKRVLDMEKKYQQLEESCRASSERKRELNATKEAIKEARVYDRNNALVVLKVNQGQDEVTSSKLEPEMSFARYDDGILVERERVEAVNARIRTFGAEKIATMDKMKDFRKNINLMQWESRFMEEQKKDLEEHYTDLHMLRVTRTLQNQIKGQTDLHRPLGQNDASRRAESKLLLMQKAHKTNLAKLEKALAKAVAKVEKLKVENAKMEKRKEELQVNVKIREKVKGNMGIQGLEGEDKEPAGSGMSAAKARLRNVAMRRKLNDVIRAQKDEIDFLKMQRQKLRERSFPSFAHTSRAVPNPDFQPL